MKRHLATIFHTDVAGYSRLTGLDEKTTLLKLNVGLKLLTDLIIAHGGKKINEAGDAVLAEFPSVTEAVETAVEFQNTMLEQNSELAIAERLEFRIGINLGEVIHDRNDIYGDDVNLAARVQEVARPGGVCITGSVYQQVLRKQKYEYDDLGYRKLKNIAQPVRVFELRNAALPEKPPQSAFFDNMNDARSVTTGGCLCGEVRFEIRGETIGSSYCHCRMCQRFAGAPASAGTGFPYEDLHVTLGEPKLYQSSVIAERAFCPNCGSSLWMKHYPWKWVFIKTANLDNPVAFPPSTHFGVESQLPWHEIDDQLPRIRSDDSPELCSAWESAGVSVNELPRSVSLSKKSTLG